VVIFTDVLSGLVLAWFTLLFVGIHGFCGRVTFKEGDDWQYILLELLLVAYFVGNLTHLRLVTPMMAVVFLLWDILQFRAHWLPFIMGASNSRIQRYYELFGQNAYILPRSRRRIVPDAYHTVQHVLMALNTVAVFLMLRH
jgi:hypothetical protein